MKDKTNLPNPFPGLRSFRSDEDYLFFGREEQTLELMERLQRNRFIAVVGTSGRGKSSLVRCGLLSRLQGGGMVGAGAHWEIAVMHPGGDPLRHLAEALLDAGLYDRAAEDAVPHLLATLGRSQFGLIQAVKQAGLPAGTNFLLVVDQFEEIFRYDEAGAAESERANDFIAMLREACAQTEIPIYVVATMRSDFIGDCSRFEGLAEAVNRGEYLIPGLSREQFKAAIEGPIRVAGGQITPRLLQRLLNDLGEEQDQLPCLQHALMRTWRVWQQRADTPALDLEDYAQVGKMSQALSVHADEVYFGLATDRQRELCAAMFKALTVEGSEKRGIRRPRRLQALCRILGVEQAELVPVIDAFRQREVSFLVPPADVELRDTTVIDLSHESLMRVWARLRDWVDEEAKSVGIFRRLSESAALWRQGKTGFYRDPELSIARAWVDASKPNAAWAEQYEGNFEEAMAYLQGSAEAAEKEVREQEAARERELAQAKALAEAERRRAEEQTRFAGRLKWLVRGVGLVAMIALAAMFVAFAARREAQENAVAARAAEEKAQAAGKTVALARSEAEKLVSFLLQDFYDELAPTGRLDTIVKLADQAIGYYNRLPAELRTTDTIRNRAFALVRRGEALRRQRDFGALGNSVNQATVELEKLFTAGDRTETTIIGLASGWLTQFTPPDMGVSEYRKQALQRADELLWNAATAPDSSTRMKLEHCRIRSIRAFSSVTPLDESIALMEDVRTKLRELKALNYSELRAAALYARVTSVAGRKTDDEENERCQLEALEVAEQVLLRRPGDIRTMGTRGFAYSSLAAIETRRSNTSASLKRWIEAAEAREQAARFDPTDADTWYLVGEARLNVGRQLVQLDHGAEALKSFHAVMEPARKAGSTSLEIAAWDEIGALEAKLGNNVGLLAARTARERLSAGLSRVSRAVGGSDIVNDASTELIQAGNQRAATIWAGKYEEAIIAAREILDRLDDLFARPEILPADRPFLEQVRERAWRHIGEANIMRGHFDEADVALRGRAVERASDESEELTSDMALRRVWHALAVAKLGRGAEALEILKPVKPFRQQALARSPTMTLALEHLARVLYVEAIAQPDSPAGRVQRVNVLNEAAALLSRIPEEGRTAHVVKTTSRWVAEERAKLGLK